MNVSTILLVLVVLIFGYYLYVAFFKNKGQQELFQSRKANTALKLSDVYPTEVRASYAHSFWILVNTMDVNQNSDKRDLLIKSDSTGQDVEFHAYLKKYSNDMVVETTVNDSNNIKSVMTCEVTNIPLQRWVSVILSVQDRTLDIYIDGKLVRTCVAANNIHLVPTAPVLNVTGKLEANGNLADSGFSGYMNKLQYYTDALTPNEAYAVYRKGPGNSKMLSLNYNVKLSLLKDNNELQSYQF